MLQHAWVFFSSFFTHALCFKAFRDPAKCFRHGMHYLVAHPLSFILIRSKWQPWPVAHCLVTHLLCFKMVRNIYIIGSILTASLHISCVLKLSETSANKNGYFSTASMHMSCFLKRSGTFINEHRYFLTALLHIFCVLKLSGTFNNDHGSFSTALLHISCVLKLSQILLVMFI